MLFAVAVPASALGLGEGLGDAALEVGEGIASCPITRVALLRSAKVKAANFFKIFFSWWQLT
ncbi:MAG: hypothetical protein WCE51_13395 [Chthoniobacterales bacterium]